MWKKYKYQQQKKVSSFNPAWCLLPPPTKVTASVTPRISNSQYYQKNMIVVASSSTTFHASKAKVGIEDEPTSPRVGCMGQIRRCKSTKSRSSWSAVTPPAPVPASAAPSWSDVTPPVPAPAAPASPPDVPRLENTTMKVKSGFSSMRTVESVEGMDPPRPVEKKEVREENLVSLWKRRCGKGREGRLQLELFRPQMQHQIC